MVWTQHKRKGSIRKHLQRASVIIFKHFRRLGLRVNPAKCEYCILHANGNRKNNPFDPSISIMVEGQEMPYNPNPRVLGFVLDPGLDFVSHFEKVLSKAYARLSLIRPMSYKNNRINPKYLVTIYMSLILSIIQYSMIPYFITKRKMRERLQVL